MSANRIFLDTNILISAVLKESPRYFHARGVLRRLEERDVPLLERTTARLRLFFGLGATAPAGSR